MTRQVTREEIKGLFSALVSRCGGIDACGAKLGISHQRVSQLQTLTHADMPTLLHVAALEAWCGEPVVTGALARAADGEELGDLLVEAMEAVEAASGLMHAVRTGEDRKKALTLAIATKREVEQVIAALSKTEPEPGA